MSVSRAINTTTIDDQSLREYMISVYNNMGIGLLLSGIVSYVIGTDPALVAMFLGGPQAWLFILAPLAMVFALSFMIGKMSVTVARFMFYAYAAVMGISLSSIFVVYQLGSVIQVFMITAIMFLSMSIYGYTTKRDLTSLGGFFLMGLLGLIAASILNIFMQNTALDFAISIVGVLIFVGLTAYDTQQIKDIFYKTHGDDRAKAGIMGALSLYLDFVNLLLHLLKLVGVKK